MPVFSRRKLVLGIAVSLNAGLLISCQSPLTSPNDTADLLEISDVGMLADVAFIVFPHKSLDDEIYQKIALAVLNLNNPAVNKGLNELKVSANRGNWMALNSDAKTALLESMQSTEFFTVVRVTAINVLYGDPAFFDLVGYGGSAIEQGGYLNRGFDDIDWLPAQGASL